jgi:hypothetical protein
MTNDLIFSPLFVVNHQYNLSTIAPYLPEGE